MSEANELTESLMKISAITEASYPATQSDIVRNIQKIARKALAELKAEDSLTLIRPLAYVDDFSFSSMSGLKPFEKEQSANFCNAIYGQDVIDSLKAELVEATEMALGQAKTLIEKDKRIAELENAARDMVRIVETAEGAMNHGAWIYSAGRRLKDVPEWVALYLAARRDEGEKK